MICYVMGEGKRVVFVHRGAGSTIGCLVMALLQRPSVEGGRQTIFHVSVATGVLIVYNFQIIIKSSNRFK